MSELKDMLEGKETLVDAFSALKGKRMGIESAIEGFVTFSPLEAKSDYLIVEVADHFDEGDPFDDVEKGFKYTGLLPYNSPCIFYLKRDRAEAEARAHQRRPGRDE